MELAHADTVDPRIRRTRLLLQQALEDLLLKKDFDRISVQDIAEQATVNRATFYDHYPDKFALLECMVGTRFAGLLAVRGVRFDGGCAGALRAMVLGVCDFLAGLPGLESERQVQMEPHLEAAVIAVVRRMILSGLQQHQLPNGVPPAILSAALSWAIFGAAREWVRTPDRWASDAVADQIMKLLAPMFGAAFQQIPDPDTPGASLEAKVRDGIGLASRTGCGTGPIE